MDKNQYLDMFIDESTEHLQAVNDHLLKLEENPKDLSIIGEVFRSAHTLKGMSATMGYEDLASLTHQMENVLDLIRNEKLAVTSELLDVVFESVDDLEAMVTDIASGGDGKRNVEAVVKKLVRIENGENPEGSSSDADFNSSEVEKVNDVGYDDFEKTVLKQSKEQGFFTYQISVSLRSDVILKAARVYMVFEVLEQIGEVVKSNPTVDQLEDEKFDLSFSVTLISKEDNAGVQSRILKVSEVDVVEVHEISDEELNSDRKEEKNDSNSRPSSSENALALQETTEVIAVEKEKESDTKSSKTSQPSNKTIRVNIDRLDKLMNLFEELVIDRGRLEQISKDLRNQELTETVERMTRISGDLQGIILNMRMVPVEQVFNRFPRMVRGLAKDLNKKVNLTIIGADTELDRTVIDEIGDPLVHLLRNSIDHGVELPSEREAKGKNPEGTITLQAYHSGNHVFIEVGDDGAGINRDRILQKALKSGVVTKETGDKMSDTQVFELLFSSGFSTAETISDISGRGVGLDVVKNKIESLGGHVTITSKEHKGTKFSVQLPLTLSIISVMLVEVQEEKYAIPLSSIIETAIIKKEEIMAVHNQKVINFRGSVVPLLNLTEFFEVPVTKEEDDYLSIVIVRKGESMAALLVNSFIGQQEVVLKSLGDYLSNIFAISGATILGDGQVALILDCNSLIK